MRRSFLQNQNEHDWKLSFGCGIRKSASSRVVASDRFGGAVGVAVVEHIRTGRRYGNSGGLCACGRYIHCRTCRRSLSDGCTGSE
jgi:hypothetical protein